MTTRTKKKVVPPPPPPRRRPWRDRRVRPLRPDVVVVDGTPLAEIRIYRELVLLTRRLAGGQWHSYPISAAALSQVFAQVPSASGLLPTGTLGTGTVSGAPFYVLGIPPRQITLQTPGRDYQIPIPPLVWAGCGNSYRIWAMDTTTISTKTPLFVAPFPNCYRDGRICWGNVQGQPVASPTTMIKALALFLEDSHFNLHLANDKSIAYPTSVLARYADLEDRGETQYPTDDLLPAKIELGWVLEGGPWRR
jgi:hypothetical protein